MSETAPRKIRSIWPPLLLIAVSVGYVVWAQRYGATPRMMPTIVGVATAILSVLDLLSRFDNGLGSALRAALGADFRNREMAHDPPLRSEAAMLGWMLVAIAAVWVIGLLPTVPLFIAAFMRVWGGQSWRASLLTAAGVLVFVVLVFEVLLDYSLYRGIVWETLA
ncbi:Tripartite tricarboxylate transporter TctB family protein [Roseivivax jejudonensis]|uniref:Tripartite tricarboxylate transporter TctB family protein n=1 Tax=Roseivivax jejudonensis TaxID=1529041 RepID=A0A1X6ZWP6_9RHOB|nr:tripartite tricarboxylate transporter TctB family protein [Roseivivax jejudonensis]SLN63974.1 Tripartite tricarboxylate transporter TctB family protein [Roseivivax jejudonensis]